MLRKVRVFIFFLLIIAPSVRAQTRITVTDASINAGDKVIWSADNEYVLSGAVFVEEGATLTIEAGTVIKAESAQGVNASALIITRGAQIFANGTADRPIIFTSIDDDLTVADDLDYTDRGRWGGVVLLGRASTNNAGNGERAVEGVKDVVSSGDPRVLYGGTDDDDNSGVMQYVSIRHSGINVGDATGNEIQGLTLGAVGRGTTVDYVESFASADDGFEFFGGTVNTKHLVSAFNADDAFDYDEGFRGKGQFWFAILAPDEAGAAAEQDGAIGDETGSPYAIPVFYNATYIGPGLGNVPPTATDRAELMIFRDNAGGKYYNSVFTEFETANGGNAINVEDVAATPTTDSRARLEAGDIALENNIWWQFGAGNTIALFAPQPYVQEYLGQSGLMNSVEDPLLLGISRNRDGMLDPRPSAESPAFSNARKEYSDAWFTPVNFIGAFGPTNWLAGWTALSGSGFVRTAVESATLPQTMALEQNYPNPFQSTTTIDIQNDRTQPIRIAVYDMLGREVAVLMDGVQPAGALSVTFSGESLAPGTYIYTACLDGQTESKTLTLLK